MKLNAYDIIFIIAVTLLAIVPKQKEAKWWKYLFYILLIFLVGLRFYMRRSHRLEVEELKREAQTTKELATRDMYHPLSQELKNTIILELREIYKQHSGIQVTIQVPTPESNMCYKVAEELGDILENAGYNVQVTRPAMVLSSSPEAVKITLNKEDLKLVNALWGTLRRFINTKCSLSEGPSLQSGQLIFKIIGEPLFSPDGVVTFK